jgi:hypothetical protein
VEGWYASRPGIFPGLLDNLQTLLVPNVHDDHGPSACCGICMCAAGVPQTLHPRAGLPSHDTKEGDMIRCEGVSRKKAADCVIVRSYYLYLRDCADNNIGMQALNISRVAWPSVSLWSPPT